MKKEREKKKREEREREREREREKEKKRGYFLSILVYQTGRLRLSGRVGKLQVVVTVCGGRTCEVLVGCFARDNI